MVKPVLEAGTSIWENQLGSQMILISDGKGGLTGTYNTAVGKKPGPVPLVGQYNLDEEFPSMGWVVQWKHPTIKKGKGWACTSWSGLVTTSGTEIIIHSVWVLTQQTTPDKAWDSHAVGCGEFKLVKSD